MNTKRLSKTPSPRSLTLAFKSFAMEASEKELDEALMSAGINSKSLVDRADAVLRSALGNTPKHGPSGVGEPDPEVQRSLHQGLSTLVRLLRRREQLTEQELAEAADVDLVEIIQIESNENYSPSPRTIFQLEEYFKLPERTLVLVSGAVSKSPGFAKEVLGFAAHSKELEKLSREEKKLLNDFVRFLVNERKKRD